MTGTSSVCPAADQQGTLVDHDTSMNARHLQGKRVAMVVFSYYKRDPRPRRAAEVLVANGMSVDLICLRENGDESQHEFFNGVNIRRVPLSRRRGGVLGYVYQYLAFLLISSTIIARRSLGRRYDLVYVHNMPDFLVLCGLIPKALGAKVILDLHDPMPELMMTIFDLPEQSKSVRLLKLVEKWSIGLVDSVVTVNQACASIFGSRSCNVRKINVVMNSPDEEIFRVRPPRARANVQTANQPFVIMYHGSLVERNGLDLAVDAFARIHRSIPGAKLRIYGSSNSFLERVMASVRERGLDTAVEYLGPKSLEQIVDAIEECDLGLVPNQRNIFTELNTPTRIFEYLALGKPVIAPRAPGICDYFDDNSLLFFELGDAEDLARRIEFVFHSPEATAEITRRGQEVHRAHTWREESQRLTGLVAALLRQPSVGA
jgi:glycosyltransferase involved in cell wall biosynthesis